MPWRGLAFLSGAQQVRFAPRVYRSLTAPISRPLVFSRRTVRFDESAFQTGTGGPSPNRRPWLVRLVIPALRAPSPPSACGAVALPGAATLAPSLGATNTA